MDPSDVRLDSSENDTVSIPGGRTQTPPEPAPRVPDRSLSIAVFGVIQLALAAFLLLTVPLAFLGPEISGLSGLETPSSASVHHGPALFSAGFNLLTAAFFVWTGIGTLRSRRWARLLVLAAARLWLLTGVASVCVWFAFGPTPDAIGRLAPGADVAGPVGAIVMALMTAFVMVFFVLLPGAFLWFFSRPSVVATFERHDTGRSWAESRPAPVLSMTLTLALLAATAALVAPLRVAPLFRRLVLGLPAAGVWLLLAALGAYLAWSYWQLRRVGFWGTLVAVVVVSAAALVSLTALDPVLLLEAADFPPEQIESFGWMGLTSRPVLLGGVVLSAIALLVGLARTCRYFGPARAGNWPGAEAL